MANPANARDDCSPRRRIAELEEQPDDRPAQHEQGDRGRDGEQGDEADAERRPVDERPTVAASTALAISGTNVVAIDIDSSPWGSTKNV